MVFYRKYRPQTISELDNAKLRETLYGIFSKTDFPHAFLFTGPKGLGKTSTARIIAKVINCEGRSMKEGERGEKETEEKDISNLQPPTYALIEPCNICETCISITKGTNLDILEIDGASNRGIDEIRDLREKVRLSPSSAKKKVYIIDEVHMLTTEAFNALLKTIEEPPAHVVFIFCTTEPQKVPATIISRCFHVSLSLATEEELVHSFKRIVAGEKIDIDEEALSEIAKLADGGFRDGAKILEEVVMIANNKITKEFIESNFHNASIALTKDKFLAYLIAKDTRNSLDLINEEIVNKGVDMKFFLSQLLIKLHSLLLEKMGIDSQSEKLKVKSEKLEIGDIQVLVSLLTKAYQDVKYAVVPQLPLEMVVIAWASFAAASVETSSVEISSSEVAKNNYSAQVIQAIKNIAYTSDKPTITTLLKKQQAIRVQSMLTKQEVKVVTTPVVTMKQSSIPSGDIDPQKSLLDNLIYSVKTYNHSIAAVLRSCKIHSMDDASIIFETAYKFHKERLDDGKSKEILEKVIKEITGRQMGIQIVLRENSRVKQKVTAEGKNY